MTAKRMSGYKAYLTTQSKPTEQSINANQNTISGGQDHHYNLLESNIAVTTSGTLTSRYSNLSGQKAKSSSKNYQSIKNANSVGIHGSVKKASIYMRQPVRQSLINTSMSFNQTVGQSFLGMNIGSSLGMGQGSISLGNKYQHNQSSLNKSSAKSKYSKAHKLEPKVLGAENTLIQLMTMPSPSHYNEKENLLLLSRDDKLSPSKSPSKTPRITSIQRVLQTNNSGAKESTTSQIQKLLKQTLSPKVATYQLKTKSPNQRYYKQNQNLQSFTHAQNKEKLQQQKYSLNSSASQIKFKAQLGSITARPSSNTKVNNFSSFAADRQETNTTITSNNNVAYQQRKRNESANSNQSLNKFQSSMIKSFHRESILTNQQHPHVRSSTITSATTTSNPKTMQNQATSKNRKDKFKSYFKHYLNSNSKNTTNSQQISHVRQMSHNKSSEKIQNMASSSHTYLNTQSNYNTKGNQKYSFAEGGPGSGFNQDSGFLFGCGNNQTYQAQTYHNQPLNMQLTPRSNNLFNITTSGRQSATGYSSSNIQANQIQPIDIRLNKCISTTSIIDKKLRTLSQEVNDRIKNKLVVLQEVIKNHHQKVNESVKGSGEKPKHKFQGITQNVPTDSHLQKNQYQTESKPLIVLNQEKQLVPSNKSLRGYKPRKIRNNLTKNLILSARPVTSPQTQLTSPQYKQSFNSKLQTASKQPENQIKIDAANQMRKILGMDTVKNQKPSHGYTNANTMKNLIQSFSSVQRKGSQTARKDLNNNFSLQKQIKSPEPYCPTKLYVNIHDDEDEVKNENQLLNKDFDRDQNKNSSSIELRESLHNPHSRSKSTNINDYTLGKKLGEGAYAVVHTAFNKKTNDRIAMKIYDKEKILSNASRKRSVSREIQLLRRLEHPNIVRLYESIDTKKTLNLVMEHVEGKSLYEYVKEKNYAGRFIPEEDVKQIIKQLLTGVKFMHSKGIAHRDLKLDNILLVENNSQNPEDDRPFLIKIIDFGFSVTCEKLQKQFCGTPSYMAPEIVKKLEYDPKASDVWAIGILTYRMLYGVPPFRAPNEKELYQKIMKGHYSFPDFVRGLNVIEYPPLPTQLQNMPQFQHIPLIPGEVSETVKDIISLMLKYEGKDRLTADQLLQHSWFNNSKSPYKSSIIEEQSQEQ